MRSRPPLLLPSSPDCAPRSPRSPSVKWGHGCCHLGSSGAPQTSEVIRLQGSQHGWAPHTLGTPAGSPPWLLGTDPAVQLTILVSSRRLELQAGEPLVLILLRLWLAGVICRQGKNKVPRTSPTVSVQPLPSTCLPAQPPSPAVSLPAGLAVRIPASGSPALPTSSSLPVEPGPEGQHLTPLWGPYYAPGPHVGTGVGRGTRPPQTDPGC